MTAKSINSMRFPGSSAGRYKKFTALPKPVLAAMVIAGLFGAEVAAADESSRYDEKSFSEQTSEYIQDYLSDHRRVGALAGSILGGALTAHPAGTVVGSLIGFFIGKQSMYSGEDAGQAKKNAARRNIVPPMAERQDLPTLSFSSLQAAELAGSTSQKPVESTLLPALQAVARQDPAPLVPTPASMPMPSALSAGGLTSTAVLPTHSTPASVNEAKSRQTANPPAATTTRVESVAATVPVPNPFVPEQTASIASKSLTREQIAMMCGSGNSLSADPRLRGMCFYRQSN